VSAKRLTNSDLIAAMLEASREQDALCRTLYEACASDATPTDRMVARLKYEATEQQRKDRMKSWEVKP